jgi:hypothetical protein
LFWVCADFGNRQSFANKTQHLVLGLVLFVAQVAQLIVELELQAGTKVEIGGVFLVLKISG